MTFNFYNQEHMVVCLCQGVSEKRVRAAICDGAHSRKAVTKACGAGAGCGGCHAAIRDLIREHQAQASRAEVPAETSVLAPVEPAAVCA
jgi:bacterioferritin-associated ferredoxin